MDIRLRSLLYKSIDTAYYVLGDKTGLFVTIDEPAKKHVLKTSIKRAFSAFSVHS